LFNILIETKPARGPVQDALIELKEKLLTPTTTYLPTGDKNKQVNMSID
jgi:hypothetical protein